MFDLTWIGIPITIAGVLFVVAFNKWLLPDRRAATSSATRASTPTEMIVEPGGPLVARPSTTTGLRSLLNTFLAEIERAKATSSRRSCPVRRAPTTGWSSRASSGGGRPRSAAQARPTRCAQRTPRAGRGDGRRAAADRQTGCDGRRFRGRNAVIIASRAAASASRRRSATSCCRKATRWLLEAHRRSRTRQRNSHHFYPSARSRTRRRSPYDRAYPRRECGSRDRARELHQPRHAEGRDAGVGRDDPDLLLHAVGGAAQQSSGT